MPKFPATKRAEGMCVMRMREVFVSCEHPPGMVMMTTPLVVISGFIAGDGHRSSVESGCDRETTGGECVLFFGPSADIFPPWY